MADALNETCKHLQAWYEAEAAGRHGPCQVCPLEERVGTLELQLRQLQASWLSSAQRGEAQHRERCRKVAQATVELICQQLEEMHMPKDWINRIRQTDVAPRLLVE